MIFVEIFKIFFVVFETNYALKFSAFTDRFLPCKDVYSFIYFYFFLVPYFRIYYMIFDIKTRWLTQYRASENASQLYWILLIMIKTGRTFSPYKNNTQLKSLIIVNYLMFFKRCISSGFPIFSISKSMLLL